MLLFCVLCVLENQEARAAHHLLYIVSLQEQAGVVLLTIFYRSCCHTTTAVGKHKIHNTNTQFFYWCIDIKENCMLEEEHIQLESYLAIVVGPGSLGQFTKFPGGANG